MNTKKVLIIIIVLAILALASWYWLFKAPTAVQAPAEVAEDTTTAITEELNTVDLGDLDAEFEAIDKDLDTL